jgi:NAD(P)-dependent dehydrogenase (short-subunit alcohol dehydrogenase family)
MTSSPASSKWSAVHLNPSGPGDARPTALQIIDDEGLRGQWKDKVVLITGASSGIGVETARALYATGAWVFLPVRDLSRGEAVASDIVASLPQSAGRVTVLSLNLESLQSVRDCAAAFLSQSKQLHVLICNAGVMATPEGRTEDGFETQFGTNHVAHFLLFQLLKPTLLHSSTPSFNSRVVMVSSSGHGFSPVLFGDFDLKKRGYDPWIAYGQSKTANIWMANEIDRRFGSQGLHASSLMPGGIRTGLQVHLPAEVVDGWLKDDFLGHRMKSTEQGAATTVWAATSAVWEGRGGRYLEDCEEGKAASPDAKVKFFTGYTEWAYDEAQAARLWEESLKLAGMN